MTNKQNLIGTGLSGMVGSRFTELYQDNFNFINLDLTAGIDITDQDQVNQVLSKYPPTTVIHLAAFTDVSKAYEQKEDKNGLVYKVNVLGTKNIALACKKYGHYLIHISTDFVFDGANPPADGYTENDIPSPIEWYGKTKYLAEQEVINSGANHLITRIAFPFRSKFPTKLDLIRNIINKLKTNSLYPMFSDQIITPTFTDDICQVLKEFTNKKPNGIYHLVGSTSISPFELAKKIAQVFNIKADIKKGSFKEYLKKDPRPRQQYLKISNQKLKKEFGYTMKTLDQALKILKSQLN
ncbi:MAG: NAD(P)-dependent oxidoreductase [Patescibacteria group bacterium]|nr:NAD(P)-dependent oxidoreductase [Patescibacteria group bacterium]